MELFYRFIPPIYLFFLVNLYINVVNTYTNGYSPPQNLGPSNQPEAYFNGSSSTYLRLQTTISLKQQIGLSFRTCLGGTLFSQQQKNANSFELSVNSKGVTFSAKINRHLYEESIDGDYLDNKWHLVVIQYKLGNATLSVERETTLLANSTYNEELLEPDLFNEQAVLLVGQQFNGCLLEGPSLVFDNSIIWGKYNVKFQKCPIPDNNCIPNESMTDFDDSCKTEPCMRHGTCVNGPSGYTCICPPRYSGKNCEMELGHPCDKNPCVNGGTCTADNSVEGYNCICHPSFTGPNCENELTAHEVCKNNHCLNGATCIERGGAKCLCPPGFKGDFCEINVDDCKPNICKNGGLCVDDVNNFTCDCSHTGYEGKYCENDINECETNPCLNQATCFNIYGSYFCQCPPKFGGPNCQYSINECLSQPCLNEGVCVNELDGYSCHCLTGFSGKHCEIEQRSGALCDASLCSPQADCLFREDELICACKSEYPGVYPNCSIDNICLNNPCKNGGKCMPWKGSYNCSCPSGFTGKVCQIKIESCLSSPCLNNGKCIADPIKGYRCNCSDDWMGDICEIPYDVCVESKPCLNNATCIITSNNKHEYKCNCLPGYKGDLCEINIDLNCVGVQCPNGRICVDLVNTYECRCPPGYSGENCTNESNPCAKEPCLHGATCLYETNSLEYTCVCPSGFQGPTCEIDIDECKLAGGSICNHGICVNREGGFDCYCRPGYTGERCNLDFDECLSMPCHHNATCINQVNNFTCICPPGYTDKDCSVDINECEPNPCKNGATCIDGVNEFTCRCPLGLTGAICDIDIDDCESSPCLNGAKCIDGLNNYTCDCIDTGYTGNHCDINIDDCESNPCSNGADCVDEVKDYHCNCHPGYAGKNCESDINECESNPCKLGGTCLERSNMTLYQTSTTSRMNITLPETFEGPFDYSNAAGYECLCVAGVTGDNCEININECESSPCLQGNCVDQINGYFCECEEGFEGVHCDIDIDECEKYKPCVNGKCIDKRANYYCECLPNYGGKNCSVELTGCRDNPCLNNGSCKPYLINETSHYFNCSCPHGFHGHICEKVSTMSFSKNSSIMINTSREEGYDIQFRFKTTLGDGLLALGKGLTYYILELSKGRLNLHSSLLNKWEGVFIGSNLNDSQWQRVFVAINLTHLVLSANDEQTIYPITFSEYNSTYTSFPLTYIGGIPNNLRKLTHGQPFLVGCTEDVLINGKWVLPENQVENSTWLNFRNVDVGCLREPQCTPNPCHSGGHCTDMWRDFSCTCERPYLGHTCQYNYTAATFGYENISDSLVTVDVTDTARRAVRTIVDISMFIRTRQPRGQIFYLGSVLSSSNLMDETYIAAQLEGGELLVRIQFNGTPEAYTVGGVKLNNGYNHLIEVIRNITLVQVKLNGTEYFRKTISATGTLDAQVLFLGGQPQLRAVRQANDNISKIEMIPPTASAAAVTTPLSNIHFKGIIQDVQISNGSSTMIVEFFPLQAEDLEIPTAFGIVTFDKSNVLEGVQSDDSCRINPCLRGTCVNTWNDYKCVCPRGFKGKNCTDVEFCELEQCPYGFECKNLDDGYECLANATYNGKTEPLQYKLIIPEKLLSPLSFSNFELSYRTRSWGTILFAEYIDDYFAIFIYHNEVAINWNINKVAVSRRFRKDRFEGQWITLYFLYKDSIFKGGFKDMVMDEAPNFEILDFDFAGFNRILVDGVIYLAGSRNGSFDYQSIIESADDNMTGYIPITDTTTSTPLVLDPSDIFVQDPLLYKVDQNKKTDYFKGCLSEVRLGGLLLPFYPAKELYPKINNSLPYFELISPIKPDIGCLLCYNSDCFNQGFCINPHDSYKCNCSEGFTADDCSIDINECEHNQCQNNSTCVDLIAKYECKCLVGFDGEHCENEIDECLSDPCKHNSTCIDLIGTFKCDCAEGFIGRQCEAPLLITCDNHPCKEGSSCKDGFNSTTSNNFTCICGDGMEGVYCDTPFCTRRHCENGSCNTTNVVPFCQCREGFEGKFCETDIDECKMANGASPCQNGGQCFDEVARFDCDCTGTGYTGLLCEIDINECKTKDICGRGHCQNLPGTFKCICDVKGKCGPSCSLDDPCEPVNPCENGECIPKCSDKPDYFCKCHHGFTGKNCSALIVSALATDSGFNILYIIIPIVLLIILAFIIGMVILVNVARSKRATRGTYSPSAQEFCNPRVELDHVLKPPPEERLI